MTDITNTIDHVGLYVEDLERSIEFYGELFGFKVHSRLDAHGLQIIHLDMRSGLLQLKKGGIGKPGSGKYNHFGVSTSDFDGFSEKLKEMDVSYWEMSLGPGQRIVNFSDPDGHDIEVCETPFNR